MDEGTQEERHRCVRAGIRRQFETSDHDGDRLADNMAVPDCWAPGALQQPRCTRTGPRCS